MNVKQVMENVEVKESRIHGKGVFAVRDFAMGETVVRWHPKPIDNPDNLTPDEERYVIKEGDQFYLMQEPERFVNHSCEPNTQVEGLSDVALRDIKAGEEITTDYSLLNGFDDFVCHCERHGCKVRISNKALQ